MPEKNIIQSRQCLPKLWAIPIFIFLLLFSSFPTAHAVRANWGVRQMGPRMEKRGQHEEAAFYYRVGLDFYTSMLQLWIGAVYNDGVDEIYQEYAKLEFRVSRYISRVLRIKNPMMIRVCGLHYPDFSQNL